MRATSATTSECDRPSTSATRSVKRGSSGAKIAPSNAHSAGPRSRRTPLAPSRTRPDSGPSPRGEGARAALGYFAAALQPAGARDRRPRLRCLVVFVDETFQGFFDLNERGYFCYGVAGIPETHYEAVTAEFASILDPYRKLLVPELNELKHTEFKRIPFPDRWKLACRMHDILLAHGCWDCPNDC